MTFGFASTAFFLSGFAALVYQIAWQRLLVLPIGTDVYSTTIIVASFMAGLGVGSLVGGQIADRLTSRQNLLLFVGAELCVGLFGMASRLVFYDWLFLHLPTRTGPQVLIGVMFAVLMWPTFWMGVSLPVLARAVTGALSGAARRVGALYALNTLGAAVGAYVGTWILLPRLGLEGALRTAAVLNLLAAAVVCALTAVRRRARHPRAEHAAAADSVDTTHQPVWSFFRWAVLYALAGFQALSLEIVWFRLLGIMLKSSAFTFGTLLTIYLAGLGIGAALESTVVSCVRRPAATFLLLQGFVSAYALLSVWSLIALLASGSAPPLVQGYVAGYEPIDAAAAFAEIWTGSVTDANRPFMWLYIFIPLLLVGPPTIAMGASFPLLQRVVIRDTGHVGRRVGALMIANIVGSTFGSIATGWIALSYLGTGASLKALALIGTTFLALALWRRNPSAWYRLGGVGVLTAAALAAIGQAPDDATLWATLHGSTPRLVISGEDASGVSIIKAEPRPSGTRGVVLVNGIGQSWIPYGNIHSVLGALPAFMHPNPRTAALIGLGSGDTLYALTGRPELTALISIEIIRPQIQTLHEWQRRIGYRALTTLLADERIRHVVGDGRIALMRSSEMFDIIEADALRPTSAYSGNLYSVGYFELVRSRLAPGGLAVTWAPTPRIHDTFASVFRYVLDFGDVLVGSEAPIVFDPEAIRRRLEATTVRDHFGEAGIDIHGLLSPYLTRSPQLTRGRSVKRTDLNEDLFPRDEFSVP